MTRANNPGWAELQVNGPNAAGRREEIFAALHDVLAFDHPDAQSMGEEALLQIVKSKFAAFCSHYHVSAKSFIDYCKREWEDKLCMAPSASTCSARCGSPFFTSMCQY
jgi:hypothetical protein